MSRALFIAALTLGLIGCGQQPVQLSTIVRVDAQLRSQTAGLVLWALGPELSDGVLLICSSLMLQDILPNDPKVNNLGHKEVDPNNASSVVLDGIDSGEGRIVYVTANDLSGGRIGAGCTGEIEVPEGGATSVEVRVFATP